MLFVTESKVKLVMFPEGMTAPNKSTSVKLAFNIFVPDAKSSLKVLVSKLLKLAAPSLAFNINVFKSLIIPVVVVSQNISKRLSTASVSMTAKYWRPGVSEFTIVINVSKDTVTGAATGTGVAESSNLPTFILAGVLKFTGTLLPMFTTLLRVTFKPFTLSTIVPSGIPSPLTYWLPSILVTEFKTIILLVLTAVVVALTAGCAAVKPGVTTIMSAGKPVPLTVSPKAIPAVSPTMFFKNISSLVEFIATSPLTGE